MQVVQSVNSETGSGEAHGGSLCTMSGPSLDDLRAARKAATSKATMSDFDDDQLLKELEVRSSAGSSSGTRSSGGLGDPQHCLGLGTAQTCHMDITHVWVLHSRTLLCRIRSWVSASQTGLRRTHLSSENRALDPAGSAIHRKSGPCPWALKTSHVQQTAFLAFTFLFITMQDIGEGMHIQDDSTPEAQEASADQAIPAECEVSRAGISRHIEAYIQDYAREVNPSYIVR